MALPGHSPPPPPFATAGSPPRLVNGQPEHHFPPPMFGPRTMLPPSPQQYPRYQPAPHAQMPLPGPVYEVKAPAPAPAPHPQHQPHTLPNPHKRPGSSMSISSMLGTEPERLNHDPPQSHNHHNARSASIAAPGMSVSAIMSPPNQSARLGVGEYPYKRSQTPDRMDGLFVGNRQRSASSSNSMTPARPLYEPPDRYGKPSSSIFHAAPPFPSSAPTKEEHEERVRRTSINAILQRPSSQPQALAPPLHHSRPFDPLPPQSRNWYADPPPPAAIDPPRPNGFSSSYDTKPPGFREIPRTIPASDPPSSAPLPQSASPDLRRTSNGTFLRGVTGLLNGPSSQSTDSNNASTHNMMRQDSSQSQSDRSIHSERNRFPHFSPLMNSAGPQHMSVPFDDHARKGSDEISHKAIVGLGQENRRRFSPVPQAVQGAQAQTPVPDGGIKSDQGKVFSGLGGGIGNSTTPIPTSMSPFKRDDTITRPTDALKMGRTVSNIGKRSRKLQDDETRIDGERDGRKSASATKPNKRTKYQNSYKADLEDMAAGSFQRRGTPLATVGGSRTTTTQVNGSTSTSSTRYDTVPIFRPKKTVKVSTVVSQTLRKPRRHLGTFQYDPEILLPEASYTADADRDICIKPKLLPSFSEADDVNCTYAVHVSKTWLQERERGIICSSRNLWGTGIYTDDTDPVAAAMHMGWIKPAFHNIDETLLARIVQDQNPKVEIGKDLKPPAQPLEIPKGRDFKITCVVMPQLEKYEETARFGVRSRAWPEGIANTPHDGVSFSILKVEIIDIGPEERRIGRTGKGKRARLQAQLLQRQRATRLEKERVERLLKRIKDKTDRQNKEEAEKKTGQNGNLKPTSPLSNEVSMEDEPAAKSTKAGVPVDNEEWRRQLATAAA